MIEVEIKIVIEVFSSITDINCCPLGGPRGALRIHPGVSAVWHIVAYAGNFPSIGYLGISSWFGSIAV